MAERFSQHLNTQIEFLERSCRAYDDGHEQEGIRIGACLRIMFYDFGNSKSLVLTHMGATSIKLLSTASNRSHNAFLPSPMVYIRTNVDTSRSIILNVEARSQLEKSAPTIFLPFADWWTSEDLTKEQTPPVTRKQLVLWAVNKDGGAHVDADLPEEYKSVIDGISHTYTTSIPGFPPASMPLEILHLAMLRQIGYKVLNSPDVQRLNSQTQ